jgi:hypothetical protein
MNPGSLWRIGSKCSQGRCSSLFWWSLRERLENLLSELFLGLESPSELAFPS